MKLSLRGTVLGVRVQQAAVRAMPPRSPEASRPSLQACKLTGEALQLTASRQRLPRAGARARTDCERTISPIITPSPRRTTARRSFSNIRRGKTSNGRANGIRRKFYGIPATGARLMKKGRPTTDKQKGSDKFIGFFLPPPPRLERQINKQTDRFDVYAVERREMGGACHRLH